MRLFKWFDKKKAENPETDFSTSASGGQGLSASKLFTSDEGKRKFQEMVELEHILKNRKLKTASE